MFGVATRLGLTSFGGPVAHLGYFHDEYVVRRKWLDEQRYADLVALCQFLPGPASSQLGRCIGMLRAGMWGAIAAWTGFTLPSAIALAVFAAFVTRVDVAHAPWLHGLALVAVAVVAQAVLAMSKTLTPDWPPRAIAVLALFVALVWQNPFAQIVTLAVAGALGAAMLRADGACARVAGGEIRGSRLGSFACVGAYFALLAVLPLCALLPGAAGAVAAVVSAFYRAGALVFGGGHVVLPLLQSAVVTPGWVTGREFVAGYGAAQAVPGPLFTFSAYLGYLLRTPLHGAAGAIVALAAIFLPSFLLVAGVLPFWDALRANPRLRGALAGINAAVVGILAAAFYRPVWTNAVFTVTDVAIAAVAFCALVFARVPPWAVALGGAVAAGLLQLSA